MFGIFKKLVFTAISVLGVFSVILLFSEKYPLSSEIALICAMLFVTFSLVVFMMAMVYHGSGGVELAYPAAFIVIFSVAIVLQARDVIRDISQGVCSVELNSCSVSVSGGTKYMVDMRRYYLEGYDSDGEAYSIKISKGVYEELENLENFSVSVEYYKYTNKLVSYSLESGDIRLKSKNSLLEVIIS